LKKHQSAAEQKTTVSRETVRHETAGVLKE